MMSEQSGQAPRSAFWRTTEFRATLYQIIALGGVVAFGWWVAHNTLHNLAKRGIHSGFSFLFPPTEANFPIGETAHIPLLQGGFLYLLMAIALGWVASVLLAHWGRGHGHPLAEDLRMQAGVVALVFVLPVLVLYATRGSFQTEVYDATKPYLIAVLTGVMNTIKVSFIGCILATIVGLVIGIARLSSNWLVAKLSGAYVEIFRNVPLLLQMLFWYFLVLNTLPPVRRSIGILGMVELNNRGVYTPDPIPQASAPHFMLAIAAAFVLIYLYSHYAKRRQEQTGEQLPLLYPSLGILIVLPGLVWLVLGQPFTFSYPELHGFNFRGGMVLTPEFSAVLIALVIYTGAFIAEVVRSGIQAVSKGQREAALAVGLRKGLVMRLVVLPQALRVIVPPLTSQYLNLTKNSSLAVAIGYPDLVSVGGTILNQSGQAIEVILIWMMVYLTFSLLISLFMNWYNTKVKLVER
ncbi:MAG TPA: amino acid ABC transporter permease [bacterium]|nr:amino acid ABC transporter permease [bacterium]